MAITQCPYCSFQVSDRANFCPQCGRALKPAPIEPGRPREIPPPGTQAASGESVAPGRAMCPGCKTVLDVSSYPAGSMARCGVCAQTFLVPGPQTPQPLYAGYEPLSNEQELRKFYSTYLIFAILVTFFCCSPFGIVAIVFVAMTKSKLDAGDLAGATRSAKNGKLWCWLSFGFGIVTAPFWFLLQFAANFTKFLDK